MWRHPISNQNTVPNAERNRIFIFHRWNFYSVDLVASGRVVRGWKCNRRSRWRSAVAASYRRHCSFCNCAINRRRVTGCDLSVTRGTAGGLRSLPAGGQCPVIAGGPRRRWRLPVDNWHRPTFDDPARSHNAIKPSPALIRELGVNPVNNNSSNTYAALWSVMGGTTEVMVKESIRRNKNC